MAIRQYIVGGILALVVICATVLGALGVVPGERVIELLSLVGASFVGGLAGAAWRTPQKSSSERVQDRPPLRDGT